MKPEKLTFIKFGFLAFSNLTLSIMILSLSRLLLLHLNFFLALVSFLNTGYGYKLQYKDEKSYNFAQALNEF